MHNYESQIELINLNAITDFSAWSHVHVWIRYMGDQNEIHLKLLKLLKNFIGLKSFRLITYTGQPPPKKKYMYIYTPYVLINTWTEWKINKLIN